MSKNKNESELRKSPEPKRQLLDYLSGMNRPLKLYHLESLLDRVIGLDSITRRYTQKGPVIEGHPFEAFLSSIEQCEYSLNDVGLHSFAWLQHPAVFEAIKKRLEEPNPPMFKLLVSIPDVKTDLWIKGSWAEPFLATPDKLATTVEKLERYREIDSPHLSLDFFTFKNGWDSSEKMRNNNFSVIDEFHTRYLQHMVRAQDPQIEQTIVMNNPTSSWKNAFNRLYQDLHSTQVTS